MKFQQEVTRKDLKIDDSKPLVLVVSDSGAIHSGFAQVVRNIFKRLVPRGEWNIVQYGWWHTQPVERVSWPIVTTDRDPERREFIDPTDKYGEKSFERVVKGLKPDVVWIMGDPWMIIPALANNYRHTYKAILYLPVDGAPLMYGWDIIKQADVVVPYLPWGKKMIERWVPDANVVSPIPHGVDTEMYAPTPSAQTVRTRQINTKVNPDDVLMVSVSRNQSRKNLPALVELTHYIRSGDYRVCSSCGKAWRNPFDYHLGKPTGEKADCQDPHCWGGGGPSPPRMRPGKPHPNFYYYMHTPIMDLEDHSWRLLDLLDAWGLAVPDEKDKTKVRYPGFRWNESVRIVHGSPELDMARLYAAADIFALPTTGEGFGLPILEAMSAGTPVVVPNVSAHPDFVREGGGFLVDIGYHICETLSTYYRGYPDLDEYLTHLLELVDNPDLRKQMGEEAREVALRYDWNEIALQWRDVIAEQIGAAGKTKRWQRLTAI